MTDAALPETQGDQKPELSERQTIRMLIPVQFCGFQPVYLVEGDARCGARN